LTTGTIFGIETAVRIFRMAGGSALGLLVAMVFGCGRAEATRPAAHATRIAPATHGQRACPVSVRAAVVARVNAARRAASLPPLTSDAGLGRAAQARASAMASDNRLSHAGWERVVRRHDDANTIGENVAYNYPSAAAVVDAWLHSSGHRANLLGRSFRRIGVGCIVDAQAHLWWAQDFAN
jgi:uncharacterized protein YkwD